MAASVGPQHGLVGGRGGGQQTQTFLIGFVSCDDADININVGNQDNQDPRVYSIYADNITNPRHSDEEVKEGNRQLMRKIKRVEDQYFDWTSEDVSVAMQRTKIQMGKKNTEQLMQEGEKQLQLRGGNIFVTTDDGTFDFFIYLSNFLETWTLREEMVKEKEKAKERTRKLERENIKELDFGKVNDYDSADSLVREIERLRDSMATTEDDEVTQEIMARSVIAKAKRALGDQAYILESASTLEDVFDAINTKFMVGVERYASSIRKLLQLVPPKHDGQACTNMSKYLGVYRILLEQNAVEKLTEEIIATMPSKLFCHRHQIDGWATKLAVFREKSEEDREKILSSQDLNSLTMTPRMNVVLRLPPNTPFDQRRKALEKVNAKRNNSVSFLSKLSSTENNINPVSLAELFTLYVHLMYAESEENQRSYHAKKQAESKDKAIAESLNYNRNKKNNNYFKTNANVCTTDDQSSQATEPETETEPDVETATANVVKINNKKLYPAFNDKTLRPCMWSCPEKYHPGGLQAFCSTFLLKDLEGRKKHLEDNRSSLNPCCIRAPEHSHAPNKPCQFGLCFICKGSHNALVCDSPEAKKYVEKQRERTQKILKQKNIDPSTAMAAYCGDSYYRKLSGLDSDDEDSDDETTTSAAVYYDHEDDDELDFTTVAMIRSVEMDDPEDDGREVVDTTVYEKEIQENEKHVEDETTSEVFEERVVRLLSVDDTTENTLDKEETKTKMTIEDIVNQFHYITNSRLPDLIRDLKKKNVQHYRIADLFQDFPRLQRYESDLIVPIMKVVNDSIKIDAESDKKDSNKTAIRIIKKMAKNHQNTLKRCVTMSGNSINIDLTKIKKTDGRKKYKERKRRPEVNPKFTSRNTNRPSSSSSSSSSS